MAGKPKRMGQIKQLIRLHGQGLGKKTIARQLGMSKNTVKAYLQTVACMKRLAFRSDFLSSYNYF
jgi:DNA-binding NarL/FixJ family response regulator